MEYKFIYIDDSNDTTGTTRGFSSKGLINVASEKPLNTLEEQIDRVKVQDIDGLILDLRLDDYENDTKKKVQFRGTTLAQEIRTRQKEGEIPQFPIFLFSGNDNIDKSLNSATMRIFDLCIKKEDIVADRYEEYQKYFIGVAKAYKDNIHALDAKMIFAFKDDDINGIDSFLEDFNLVKRQSHTSSSLVYFMINEILEKDSVLVSEELLACRLGIDIVKSKEAWKQIKEALSHTKYNGALSEGWDRWWMHKVEKWWIDNMASTDDMRYISADSRVAALKNTFKEYDIYTPINIPKCPSRDFWTLCAGCNQPLDITDGIVIANQENIYSWQDVRYVSVECALTRKNSDSWVDIANYEKIRFSELVEIYKRKR